jgi:hypothetical protein
MKEFVFTVENYATNIVVDRGIAPRIVNLDTKWRVGRQLDAPAALLTGKGTLIPIW